MPLSRQEAAFYQGMRLLLASTKSSQFDTDLVIDIKLTEG